MGLKWITNKTSCIAQVTVLDIMQQPKLEKNVKKNGYV